MPELRFHILDELELRLFETWFQDEELRRRIEPPTAQWFAYVSHTSGSYAWMIYEGDIPVGQMALDTHADKIGYFSITVNPTLRRRGYGVKILRAFLKRQEVISLSQLDATVEPDNVASIRCIQRAGFVQVSPEPDQEGFLHFTCNPASPYRNA